MRVFARAAGSNDCAVFASTRPAREDSVSSSLISLDRLLAGALSEALRRPRKAWGRADGASVLGTALVRYLDGSLAAILVVWRTGMMGLGVLLLEVAVAENCLRSGDVTWLNSCLVFLAATHGFRQKKPRGSDQHVL